MKIKAILDANVFISGVFWKGPPFEILKAWLERFRLAISMPILDEYRRVLDEFAKKRPMPVLNSVLKVIELHSELVKPVSFSEPVCSDPDDDKFLEARNCCWRRLRRERGIRPFSTSSSIMR